MDMCSDMKLDEINQTGTDAHTLVHGSITPTYTRGAIMELYFALHTNKMETPFSPHLPNICSSESPFGTYLKIEQTILICT